MRPDLIIRHAQVIDGSGRPRFPADLAVEGDRIAAVGDLGGTEAEHSIDGSGCILAPGFIDVHTHDDRALIDEPQHRCKTSQGVTTVVTGNCGFSLAPLRPRGDLPKEYRLLGEAADYRYGALEIESGLGRAEVADRADAIALDRHIGLKAGSATAIDDLGVADDEIRAQGELRRGGASSGSLPRPVNQGRLARGGRNRTNSRRPDRGGSEATAFRSERTATEARPRRRPGRAGHA